MEREIAEWLESIEIPGEEHSTTVRKEYTPNSDFTGEACNWGNGRYMKIAYYKDMIYMTINYSVDREAIEYMDTYSWEPFTQS